MSTIKVGLVGGGGIADAHIRGYRTYADAIEVTAEIPGVKPEEIDVQLKDGRLTIKGEKKEEKDDKQKDYHIVERSYGMFERSFTLPGDVATSRPTVKCSVPAGFSPLAVRSQSSAKLWRP